MMTKLGDKRGTAVAALAFAVAMTGCYKATFYRDPSVVRGELHERWTSFFLFGLVGTESFDVHEFCAGARVAQVQTGSNVGTGIVGALTLGIYTPRKVYVTCEAGAPPRSAATRRSLEIDATASGAPVRARYSEGSEMVTARIEKVGDHQYRISPEETEVR